LYLQLAEIIKVSKGPNIKIEVFQICSVYVCRIDWLWYSFSPWVGWLGGWVWDGGLAFDQEFLISIELIKNNYKQHSSIILYLFAKSVCRKVKLFMFLCI